MKTFLPHILYGCTAIFHIFVKLKHDSKHSFYTVEHNITSPTLSNGFLMSGNVTNKG